VTEDVVRALYRIMAKWAYAECAGQASPAELVAWVMGKLPPPVSAEAEMRSRLWAGDACEQLCFEIEAERFAASCDGSDIRVRLDGGGYGWWKP
jgi:hypothetical protein